LQKIKILLYQKRETQEEKETDYYTNRIQFFKDHIELKKQHPEYYSNVDINFENLLSCYLTTEPRETFYQKIFGRSFAEVRADSIPTSIKDF